MRHGGTMRRKAASALAATGIAVSGLGLVAPTASADETIPGDQVYMLLDSLAQQFGRTSKGTPLSGSFMCGQGDNFLPKYCTAYFAPDGGMKYNGAVCKPPANGSEKCYRKKGKKWVPDYSVVMGQSAGTPYSAVAAMQGIGQASAIAMAPTAVTTKSVQGDTTTVTIVNTDADPFTGAPSTTERFVFTYTPKTFTHTLTVELSFGRPDGRTTVQQIKPTAKQKMPALPK